MGDTGLCYDMILCLVEDQTVVWGECSDEVEELRSDLLEHCSILHVLVDLLSLVQDTLLSLVHYYHDDDG